MDKYKYTTLKIDPEFQDLIPPLTIDERKILEENLINDGCREPISIWHGIILDGHNRYEICTRNSIPFRVVTIPLSSRTEAIAWICANQLGRRNITEETRKYLIGKRYEAEKTVTSRNRNGHNQHTPRPDPPEADDEDIEAGTNRCHWTAKKLGKEYHISHTTVQKYGAFARAVDALEKKDPALPPRILSGSVKMSHENIVRLSKLSAKEVKKLGTELRDSNSSFVRYTDSRKGLETSGINPGVLQARDIGAVKEMPTFDPDSEISGLTLTIPMWVSSLERISKATNMQFTSKAARAKLEAVLLQLRRAIDEMVTDIRGA